MIYQIWLSLLKGDAAAAARRSYLETGDAKAAYQAVRDMFSAAETDLSEAQTVYKACERTGCGIMPSSVFGYNEGSRLPLFLYCKGSFKETASRAALVGARRCTEYGRSVTLDLASDLAKHNIAVVSGLAKGVDAYAHTGCIDSGGYTIAVLGCGIDYCYPLENKPLYKRIAETGLIVSEYPPGTRPSSFTFPRRNRIIAALSDTVTVVEAGKKSGALITAEYALKYQKKLYAVPGRIDSKESTGCNRLLADGKAFVFMPGCLTPKEDDAQLSLPLEEPSDALSAECAKLVMIVKRNSGKMPISELRDRTGADSTHFFDLVTELELRDMAETRGNEIWLRR